MHLLSYMADGLLILNSLGWNLEGMCAVLNMKLSLASGTILIKLSLGETLKLFKPKQ